MKSGQVPPPYRQGALEERKGNVSFPYSDGKREIERERESDEGKP